MEGFELTTIGCSYVEIDNILKIMINRSKRLKEVAQSNMFCDSMRCKESAKILDDSIHDLQSKNMFFIKVN